MKFWIHSSSVNSQKTLQVWPLPWKAACLPSMQWLWLPVVVAIEINLPEFRTPTTVLLGMTQSESWKSFFGHVTSFISFHYCVSWIFQKYAHVLRKPVIETNKTTPMWNNCLLVYATHPCRSSVSRKFLLHEIQSVSVYTGIMLIGFRGAHKEALWDHYQTVNWFAGISVSCVISLGGRIYDYLWPSCIVTAPCSPWMRARISGFM